MTNQNGLHLEMELNMVMEHLLYLIKKGFYGSGIEIMMDNLFLRINYYYVILYSETLIVFRHVQNFYLLIHLFQNDVLDNKNKP